MPSVPALSVPRSHKLLICWESTVLHRRLADSLVRDNTGGGVTSTGHSGEPHAARGFFNAVTDDAQGEDGLSKLDSFPEVFACSIVPLGSATGAHTFAERSSVVLAVAKAIAFCLVFENGESWNGT